MPQGDALERFVQDALTGAPPAMRPGFEARLRRRVRRRRPTRAGGRVLAAYGLVATAVVVWSLRDLPPAAIVSSLAVCVPVAGAVSAYAHRMVRGH